MCLHDFNAGDIVYYRHGKDVKIYAKVIAFCGYGWYKIETLYDRRVVIKPVTCLALVEDGNMKYKTGETVFAPLGGGLFTDCVILSRNPFTKKYKVGKGMHVESFSEEQLRPDHGTQLFEVGDKCLFYVDGETRIGGVTAYNGVLYTVVPIVGKSVHYHLNEHEMEHVYKTSKLKYHIGERVTYVFKGQTYMGLITGRYVNSSRYRIDYRDVDEDNIVARVNEDVKKTPTKAEFGDAIVYTYEGEHKKGIVKNKAGDRYVVIPIGDIGPHVILEQQIISILQKNTPKAGWGHLINENEVNRIENFTDGAPSLSYYGTLEQIKEKVARDMKGEVVKTYRKMGHANFILYFNGKKFKVNTDITFEEI